MEGKNSSIMALLEQQSRSKAAAKPPARVDANDDNENEYVAFANGRIGTRPQLAVIFRKADGAVKALSYAHLYSVEADDPASGFVAEFTQTKVRLSGRNLQQLFIFICQHRAWEVQEARRDQTFQLSHENPVIEKIEFT